MEGDWSCLLQMVYLCQLLILMVIFIKQLFENKRPLISLLINGEYIHKAK